MTDAIIQAIISIELSTVLLLASMTDSRIADSRIADSRIADSRIADAGMWKRSILVSGKGGT